MADQHLSRSRSPTPFFTSGTKASIAINTSAVILVVSRTRAPGAISIANTTSIQLTAGTSAGFSSGGGGGGGSGGGGSGRCTGRAVAVANTTSIDPGTILYGQLGFDTEFGFGGVALGKEDIQRIVPVPDEVEGVQVNCAGLSPVDATQVDDQPVVDEDEHIIVSDESEGLPSEVGEGGMELVGEVVVMPVVLVVAPSLSIQREKGQVFVDEHPASSAKLSQRNGVVEGSVHIGRVAVPLVKVGFSRGGSSSSAGFCIDWFLIGSQGIRYQSRFASDCSFKVWVSSAFIFSFEISQDSSESNSIECTSY
jgi:hypothetical protein